MMVAAGQLRGTTGQLQSVQWSCMYAATIVTGVVGGALSQWGMQQAGFLIAGLCCAVSLIAVWLLVREARPPVGARWGIALDKKRCDPGRKTFLVARNSEMRRTFQQPGVVTIGAFLFLWSFNPFLLHGAVLLLH